MSGGKLVQVADFDGMPPAGFDGRSGILALIPPNSRRTEVAVKLLLYFPHGHLEERFPAFHPNWWENFRNRNWIYELRYGIRIGRVHRRKTWRTFLYALHRGILLRACRWCSFMVLVRPG
jgi:hypothetical protein